MNGKQKNIIGIPENLLHLLMPIVQNLMSTFFIWSEFSTETYFVYMVPTAEFGNLHFDMKILWNIKGIVSDSNNIFL